jgi:exodeoxyribonuclease VII large subunit
VHGERDRLQRAGERLREAPRRVVATRRQALDAAAGRLRALSPHATVSRGYAVVRRDGLVVSDATTVAVGDRIDVELARGALGSRVEDVAP